MASRNLYRWLKWRIFQPDIGNQPVHMVRQTLHHIPEFALPAENHLRPYQAGDEEYWRTIHLQAGSHNEFPPEKFNQQFGADTAVLQKLRKLGYQKAKLETGSIRLPAITL